MLSRLQATEMLRMQDAMNQKVDKDWRTANFAWWRAIIVETAEAIDKHPWKWWKDVSAPRDLSGLQIELVDIWHFVLSSVAVHFNDDGKAVKYLSKKRTDTHIQLGTIVLKVEDLNPLAKYDIMASMAGMGQFSMALFDSILKDAEMTWSDLYLKYIGKNVLNHFRQDNGYKAKDYRKIWDGREDNEHLVEILAKLDPADPKLQSKLRSGLKSRYLKAA